MNAQQMKTDVVANNLANSNTTGFKKSKANFEDLMYQTTLVAELQNLGKGNYADVLSLLASLEIILKAKKGTLSSPKQSLSDKPH